MDAVLLKRRTRIALRSVSEKTKVLADKMEIEYPELLHSNDPDIKNLRAIEAANIVLEKIINLML